MTQLTPKTKHDVCSVACQQAQFLSDRIQPRRMELLHHQATMRETDGQFVCSRCGLVNPSDDQPCIPVNIEPAAHGDAIDPEGNAA